MARLQELSIGSRVKIFIDGPDNMQLCGTVIALNNESENPGKLVGVQLDTHIPIAHECDGLCEKGTGWWTRPENVAVI